jgi:hypothetical protein
VVENAAPETNIKENGGLMEQEVSYYKIALEAYEKGLNIANTLRERGASKSCCIELAYDIQAGDYTRNFSELNLTRNKELHSVINKYLNQSEIQSIGVFGVGEAKNWIGFEGDIEEFSGVELSYSRIRYARKNLDKCIGIKHFELIKGDASEKIFEDNSFDISITLHSIEPNGNEQGAAILRNVINSAAKYVLLFEPDFLTAGPEMKQRMLKHDYVRNISDELKSMDSINIIDKYIMNTQENKHNLTTCWIIEKKQKMGSTKSMICPISGGELIKYSGTSYSVDTGLAYSKIGDVLFLNKKDAIYIGRIDQ